MTDNNPPFMGPVYKPRVATQCTNWAQYGLLEIWQMLEHEDGNQSWTQASAWAVMGDLCEFQAKRLRDAAAALAQVWPPEHSPASRMFLDVVETMAVSMDRSAVSAVGTGRAVEDVVAAIGTTRQKIAALVQHRKEREAEFQQREANTLPWLRGMDSLIDGQRTELDRAAQQIMRDADVVPAEARAAIEVPEPFGVGWHQPSTPLDLDGDPSGGAFTGTSHLYSSPAFVPPVVPFPQPISTGPASGGPVLDGAGGPVTTPPHAPPPPGAPTVPAPGGPAWGTLPTISYIAAGVGAAGVIGAATAPGTGSGPTHATSGSNSGGVPERTAPRAGGTSAAGTSGHPMMAPPMIPPPGVAGARSTGTGGSPVAGVAGARRRHDPDDPWTVREGVPAVLEPTPDDAEHHPGPGVIGIDR